MFSFFNRRPPTPKVEAAPAAPAPVVESPAKPSGQFSPDRIKRMLIAGACLVVLLLAWVNQKSALPRQVPAAQAAAATPAEAAAERPRNFASEVDETMDRAQVRPADVPYPLDAAPAISPRSLGRSEPVPAAFPSRGVPTEDLTATPQQRERLNQAREALQAEADKRELESLGAGLIVKSERINKEAAGDRAGAGRPVAVATTSTVPPPVSINTAPPPPPPANALQPAPAGQALPDRQARGSRPAAPSLSRVGADSFVLFEGTLIETVLTNRLNSSFTGPVQCMVTTDVWSHSRQHLLLPQGTKVFGEARRLTQMGQDRLAVVFHRLVMPDGFSVSLDNFTGLSQVGETGLKDKTNHHYVQMFGVSVALGAIAGLAVRGTGYGGTPSGGDAFRQGFSQELSQEGTQILDRFLNVLPTVTIREGVRVKVYLLDDLSLPAYDQHAMAGDL